MQTRTCNSKQSCLIDGKYGIQDLIDLDELRNLFEQFTLTTGFTIGFLDHPGMNILVATGWKNICTQFHRRSSASEAICTKSNKHLLDSLKTPGEIVIEYCENGLVDCATPIIIEGIHVASLATGQMLLQRPDLDRFKRQANAFGFEEAAYLKALSEVVVVDEQALKNATGFLGAMAQMISQAGYAKLKAEQEVAERKKTEMSLQRTLHKLVLRDRALGAISQGVLVSGPDRLITYANKAFEEITGYSEQEMLGQPCKLLQGAGTSVEVTQKMHEALAAQQSFHAEILNYRKDGSPFWNDLSITPVFDAANQLSQFVGVQRDVTQRKNAEIALKDSQSLITTVFDSLDEHIVVLDAKGIIVAINDIWLKFARENGASESLCRGVGLNYLASCKSDSHTTQTDDSTTAAIGIINVLNGTLEKFEFEYSCHSPEIQRWFNMRVVPLRGQQGGAVVIHENITERKKMECERSDHNQKFSALSRRLVALQEEARRRLAGELHDRTSPNLAAIGINLELTLMAMREGNLDELAERMEDNSALIEDTAASIREICADLRPPALDYAGLVPAIEAYSSQFSKRTGVVVQFLAPHDNARLAAEMESMLFRIFQEALTNTAKHAQAKKVVVELYLDEKKTSLTVTDDGRGFDPAKMPVESGLGIINMREMCEFSGGSFQLESSLGHGTRIHFEKCTEE